MIDREISSKKYGGVQVWPSDRIEIARVSVSRLARRQRRPVNTSRFVKKCDMPNSL